MEQEKRTKVIGGVIVILVIMLVVGYFIVRPKPPKHSQFEPGGTDASMTVTTHESEAKVPQIELTDSQKLLLDRMENEEAILQVVTDFMDIFDNVSTDDYQELMPTVHPIMTKNAQKNLTPFYSGDKNMDSIKTTLTDTRHYLFYEQSEKEARVMTLATKIQEFNDDKTRYEMRYMIEHRLVKEGDDWKIDLRVSQPVPDTSNSQFFDS